MTYNLNLFYNKALYWPRHLNPAVLPLVCLCTLGWAFASVGKFGRKSMQLSLIAAFCLAVTGLLSLVQKYPFGGVRQTLFMAPFFFVFTAYGFYMLVNSRIGKMFGAALAGTYMVLWIYNLPLFYKERTVPFNSTELVEIWEQNGRLKR